MTVGGCRADDTTPGPLTARTAGSELSSEGVSLGTGVQVEASSKHHAPTFLRMVSGPGSPAGRMIIKNQELQGDAALRALLTDPTIETTCLFINPDAYVRVSVLHTPV